MVDQSLQVQGAAATWQRCRREFVVVEVPFFVPVLSASYFEQWPPLQGTRVEELAEDHADPATKYVSRAEVEETLEKVVRPRLDDIDQKFQHNKEELEVQLHAMVEDSFECLVTLVDKQMAVIRDSLQQLVDEAIHVKLQGRIDLCMQMLKDVKAMGKEEPIAPEPPTHWRKEVVQQAEAPVSTQPWWRLPKKKCYKCFRERPRCLFSAPQWSAEDKGRQPACRVCLGQAPVDIPLPDEVIANLRNQGDEDYWVKNWIHRFVDRAGTL